MAGPFWGVSSLKDPCIRKSVKHVAVRGVANRVDVQSANSPNRVVAEYVESMLCHPILEGAMRTCAGAAPVFYDSLAARVSSMSCLSQCMYGVPPVPRGSLTHL